MFMLSPQVTFFFLAPRPQPKYDICNISRETSYLYLPDLKQTNKNKISFCTYASICLQGEPGSSQLHNKYEQTQEE